MTNRLRLSFLAGLTALGVAGAHAQTSRSPFLPPDSQAAPVATSEEAGLQFCGYFGEGDAMRYCIYDPARRRSVWLRAGDEDGPVRLESFDPENRTVSVVHSGRALTLKLQSAKLANNGAGPSGGGAFPSASPLPAANNPLVNTVVTNPTPADEARRLEAVAAEVRRRRALRQAAAQNAANQGGANSGPQPEPRPGPR